MEKIISLLERLNANIEQLLKEKESDEELVFTKKQAMNYLRVSASTIDYLAKTRGKRFKIGKNAYSVNDIKLLKKKREN